MPFEAKAASTRLPEVLSPGSPVLRQVFSQRVDGRGNHAHLVVRSSCDRAWQQRRTGFPGYSATTQTSTILSSSTALSEPFVAARLNGLAAKACGFGMSLATTCRAFRTAE